jgi:uncharacterized protein with von Willebrand factor type A (vWA) domain
MADEQGAAAAGSSRRKVKSLDPQIFKGASARVQELTIADLNTLASVASGAETAEGKLADLDADDLRSLDEAFHQAKLQAADMLARRLKRGANLTDEDQELFDNWSCCCCTPCCCCAAADVDPFE